MSWSNAIDLALGALPVLLITWLITGVLLALGWLLLVEGLQGSDHAVVHVFEVFFQGKEIEHREISRWKIIFGMVVMFAGAVFWSAAMLSVAVRTVGQGLSCRSGEKAGEG